RLMVDPLSLTVDACLAAVADAGVALDDIDGLSTYPGPAGMGMGACGASPAAARRLGRGGGGGRVSGPMQEWRAPFGALSAANWIGINANHYLHRYGAPREMLGWIALNGRANAARNPAAIYRDPMTMDDSLSPRPITTPFGLYDCDVPCDGSIAVVVSDASVASDLPRQA